MTDPPVSDTRKIELSLRPYHGKLFLVTSKSAYSKAHEELFATPDILTCAESGRFCGGEGKDGMWTYLVYANMPHYLAHELTHVLLHVWERCGMNPSDSGGEAFCYMLSQLMLDAANKKRGSNEPIPS